MRLRRHHRAPTESGCAAIGSAGIGIALSLLGAALPASSTVLNDARLPAITVSLTGAPVLAGASNEPSTDPVAEDPVAEDPVPDYEVPPEDDAPATPGEAPRGLELEGQPPEGPASEDRAPEPPVEPEWTLCRVDARLLEVGAPGTVQIHRADQLLFLGEDLDFQRQATLGTGSSQAIVDVRVKVRAIAARSPGVVYSVTTSADVVAGVGSDLAPEGRNQVRHLMLELPDTMTRMIELFRTPELDQRILLAVSASPVHGRDPAARPWLPQAPDPGALQGFLIEADHRTRDGLVSVRSARVQAAQGHEARFTFRIGPKEESPAAEVPPERRLGPGVRVVDRPRAKDSGWGKDHLRKGTPAPDVAHRPTLDTSFLGDHQVQPSRQPATVTLREARKLSDKQRKAAMAAAARRDAVERSKVLPTSAREPAREPEEIAIVVTPLHATEDNLQVEVHVVGRITLPGDDVATPFDSRFIEHLHQGQPLEFALAELARGEDRSEDIVVRITPES